MIPDPSPPPFMRSRRLMWPAVGFAALMLAPAWVPVAVGVLLVGGRLLRLAIKHAQRPDSGSARRASNAGGLPIGVDRSGSRVAVPEEALAAHGLILGATGAGKSTTLLTLLTEQARRGCPVVAIDLKGSPTFAAQLRQAAATAGRGFINWTPDGGAHWNPLAVGNATELKDKLLGTERFTEPHYRRAAERYLQIALQVALEADPQQELTLTRVVELMAPERLAVAARRLSHPRRAYVRDYLGSLTSDQVSAVRGLASRLAVVAESHSGRFLEPDPSLPTVDLRRALEGAGEVVLFSLNSSTYGSLAGMLGTLAVQDLVAAAGARLAAMGPIDSSLDASRPSVDPAAVASRRPLAVVAIDEFSALRSDNVLALLARGRESGIGVLLATQELADLDRAGRGVRDQVLGNTAVKIAHRQDVPESAETLARLAGTVRVWETSYQSRPSARGLRGQDVSTNARLVERFAVDPEQVRSLGTGEALVIVKSPRASARLARIRRQPPAPGVTR